MTPENFIEITHCHNVQIIQEGKVIGGVQNFQLGASSETFLFNLKFHKVINELGDIDIYRYEVDSIKLIECPLAPTIKMMQIFISKPLV